MCGERRTSSSSSPVFAGLLPPGVRRLRPAAEPYDLDGLDLLEDFALPPAALAADDAAADVAPSVLVRVVPKAPVLRPAADPAVAWELPALTLPPADLLEAPPAPRLKTSADPDLDEADLDDFWLPPAADGDEQSGMTDSDEETPMVFVCGSDEDGAARALDGEDTIGGLGGLPEWTVGSLPELTLGSLPELHLAPDTAREVPQEGVSPTVLQKLLEEVDHNRSADSTRSSIADVALLGPARGAPCTIPQAWRRVSSSCSTGASTPTRAPPAKMRENAIAAAAPAVAGTVAAVL